MSNGTWSAAKSIVARPVTVWGGDTLRTLFRNARAASSRIGAVRGPLEDHTYVFIAFERAPHTFVL